jgi:hypothetical protein
MLGDKLGQESGQVIGTRILASDAGPRMETTIQMQGSVLGVDTNDTATYWSMLRPDGTMYGEGSGIVMTAEGPATWRGAGVGHPSGEGLGGTFRGAIYYETTAPSLERLNHCAAVYEFVIDADGKCRTEVWEWS